MLHHGIKFHKEQWPTNDAGVTKRTPSATRLFGGGRQKSETIAGDHSGDACRSRRYGTRTFWTERPRQ
jgi:hypothetical protein